MHLPVQKVASRLPAIRGLHFKRVPSVSLVSKLKLTLLSAEQLAAKLRRLPAAQRARIRGFEQQARIATELPVLLGLVPPHPAKSQVQQVAQLEGVYDDAANRIYLVKDTVGKDPVEIQTVLAHELTHALDEQNVGPDHFQFHPPLVEAADAEHAVREGSAVLSQARYGIRYLGAFRPVSLYLQTTYPPPSGSRLARLAGEELEFIYASGARFVQALYRRGGWGLVDRALRNPPRTTASILYPRRWPAHDVSVPPTGDPTAAFGAGWTRVLAGDMDAFSTEELFSSTGPPSAAKKVVRDWIGGRVALWHRRGAKVDPGAPDHRAVAAVLQWRWRGTSDSAAAKAAIVTYLVRTFHATPAGGGTWRWPAGAAAFVSSGATTALVLGPTPALARAAAEAAARP